MRNIGRFLGSAWIGALALGGLAMAQEAPQQEAAKLYQYLLGTQPARQDVLVGRWEFVGRMGVAVDPADDALRSQLGLPPGEGVVVRQVSDKSPAGQAGIKRLDVLKSIDGKPLASSADARKLYEEAAGAQVTVDLIRAGKPLTVKVPCEKTIETARELLIEAIAHESDYWLGVEVSRADDTLRSHLNLPAGKGLVVSSVLPGSPAERAGLKANDILLSMGGHALGTQEELVKQIQAMRDKAVELELIRAGKPLRCEIKPERRKPEEKQPAEGQSPKDLVFHLYRPGVITTKDPNLAVEAPSREAAQTQRQLDEVIKQLKELRSALDALGKGLKKD